LLWHSCPRCSPPKMTRRRVTDVAGDPESVSTCLSRSNTACGVMAGCTRGRQAGLFAAVRPSWLCRGASALCLPTATCCEQGFSLAVRTAAVSFHAGPLCRYAKILHTVPLAERDDEPPTACEMGVKQGVWVVLGLVTDHAGSESCAASRGVLSDSRERVGLDCVAWFRPKVTLRLRGRSGVRL
jgi:hypothetical protein